jgi:hypothetical protein
MVIFAPPGGAQHSVRDRVVDGDGRRQVRFFHVAGHGLAWKSAQGTACQLRL